MTHSTHTPPQAGPMYHYQTLSEALSHAMQEGYTANFRIEEDGLRDCGEDKLHSPSSVEIDSTYRIEGLSDPADQANVYALRLSDGSRGTLVESHGAAAEPRLIEFLEEVRGKQ